jgi:hypothetical protein
MTEMVSHWPVVLELPVRTHDRDADGCLTDDALERLFAEGRAAYAAECPELDLTTADVSELALRPRGAPAEGTTAVVGIAVTEVFPDGFTMEAKVRPEEGSGIAGSATCLVSPAGGVSDELRSRLIALAQTARHLH